MFGQGHLVAVIDASVVETVDELLDHLYADATGLQSTARRRRFARHMGTRIKRCSIIDNDDFYPTVLHAYAEMKFVGLTSGPRVLDDIAKNLVERDLKLDHCFAWD